MAMALAMALALALALAMALAIALAAKRTRLLDLFSLHLQFNPAIPSKHSTKELNDDRQG